MGDMVFTTSQLHYTIIVHTILHRQQTCLSLFKGGEGEEGEEGKQERGGGEFEKVSLSLSRPDYYHYYCDLGGNIGDHGTISKQIRRRRIWWRRQPHSWIIAKPHTARVSIFPKITALLGAGLAMSIVRPLPSSFSMLTAPFARILIYLPSPFPRLSVIWPWFLITEVYLYILVYCSSLLNS